MRHRADVDKVEGIKAAVDDLFFGIFEQLGDGGPAELAPDGTEDGVPSGVSEAFGCVGDGRIGLGLYS